jgi:hypothetical protein
LILRRYWTNTCQSCVIKHSCTTGKERRITRWENAHVLEAVQRRPDDEKMRLCAFGASLDPRYGADAYI